MMTISTPPWSTPFIMHICVTDSQYVPVSSISAGLLQTCSVANLLEWIRYDLTTYCIRWKAYFFPLETKRKSRNWLVQLGWLVKTSSTIMVKTRESRIFFFWIRSIVINNWLIGFDRWSRWSTGYWPQQKEKNIIRWSTVYSVHTEPLLLFFFSVSFFYFFFFLFIFFFGIEAHG